MKTQIIRFDEITSATEKELHVGSSTIIVKTKTTMHFLSPLLFRQCLTNKMNYVTSSGDCEFEYDVLMYINDIMNNDNNKQ